MTSERSKLRTFEGQRVLRLLNDGAAARALAVARQSVTCERHVGPFRAPSEPRLSTRPHAFEAIG